MVTAFLKNDERNLKKVVRSLATPSGVGSGTGSAELIKYSVGHNLQPGLGEPRGLKIVGQYELSNLDMKELTTLSGFRMDSMLQ